MEVLVRAQFRVEPGNAEREVLQKLGAVAVFDAFREAKLHRPLLAAEGFPFVGVHTQGLLMEELSHALLSAEAGPRFMTQRAMTMALWLGRHGALE